ncbi:predicted protein [Streptomyces albidoflavus]|nr:predicted protein [Streptomyces albidoflavus]
MPCGELVQTWGRSWGELTLRCGPCVGNFGPSTGTPGCPPAPCTGPVDKKPPPTCGDGVIHGIHRPYYYVHE